MKTFLQTLFFLLLVTRICFAQWYQQNSATLANLSDVKFINTNDGFAVGDSGTILRTSNGGYDWIKQTTGTTVNLKKVCVVNDSIIWAVGDSVILNTFDAGMNWNMIATESLYSLASVFFVDSNTGWIVNESNLHPNTNIILHTSNAGQDWIQKNISRYFLRDIYFINPNTGILVGGGNTIRTSEIILKTIDGGVTWSEKQAGSEASLRRICFINADSGFVVGGRRNGRSGRGYLLRTIDAGENWQIDSVLFNITENYSWSSFNDLYFSNYNNGIIVGSCFNNQGEWVGLILRTSDGGQRWEQQFYRNLTSFNGISIIDANNGWIVGDEGIIYHTTNGGVTFVAGEQIDELPTEFLLSTNYPNPFNPITKLKYSIPRSSNVIINVYDILGNEIETLVNEEKPPGKYEKEFNGNSLSSGVYFYQLNAGGYLNTKKMILLK